MNNLIITSQEHGVFTITLNRLNKKNALNTEMYQQLCLHFTFAQQSPNIHCVVIRGDQACFTAGNDLQDFIDSSDEEGLVALDFVRVLASFDKPLIAAVAGVAIGIGTTLLLHCDIVIAAETAYFQLPFTQLGLCPEAGSSLLLANRIGHNRAFELLVLGKKFTAKQASQYGLVNQVCSADQLFAISSEIALSIARLPSDAVITSRRLMKQATQQSLPQVIESEAGEFTRLMNSPECKNILASFFSK